MQEIPRHQFQEFPHTLLDAYPFLTQNLKFALDQVGSRRIWEYMEHEIEYGGWICQLTFLWRYFSGRFHITNVRIFREQNLEGNNERLF